MAPSQVQPKLKLIDTPPEEDRRSARVHSEYTSPSRIDIDSSFPDGYLKLAMDPDLQKPRVIARFDKDANELIIRQVATGAEAHIKCSPDDFVMSRVQDLWNQLRTSPDDYNTLRLVSERLRNLPDSTVNIIPGTTPSQYQDVFDRIGTQAQALFGGRGAINRTQTLEDILSGRESMEIWMNRSPESWNKMRVSIENGFVFVTLQSTGHSQPNNNRIKNLDVIPGPTSVELRLGTLEGLQKDNGAGLDKLIGRTGERGGVLDTFINRENATTNLFRRNCTLSGLLNFEHVHLRSICHALIEDASLPGIKLTKDAHLDNVTIKKSLVELEGSRAMFRALKIENSAVGINCVYSKFLDCDLKKSTVLYGSIRGSYWGNVDCHANCLQLDLRYLDLEERQYHGIRGAARISGMLATWNRLDERLKHIFKSEKHKEYQILESSNNNYVLRRLHIYLDESITQAFKHKLRFHAESRSTDGTLVSHRGWSITGTCTDGKEATLYVNNVKRKMFGVNDKPWYMEMHTESGEIIDRGQWAPGSGAHLSAYDHYPIALGLMMMRNQMNKPKVVEDFALDENGKVSRDKKGEPIKIVRPVFDLTEDPEAKLNFDDENRVEQQNRKFDADNDAELRTDSARNMKGLRLS